MLVYDITYVRLPGRAIWIFIDQSLSTHELLYRSGHATHATQSIVAPGVQTGPPVQSRRRKLATGRVWNTRIGHSINQICIARAAVMHGFH
jgi:hypothetical protein